MTKAERSIALFLAASVAGGIALVVCQEIAGGVLARILDVPDAEAWGDLGLRRGAVFKMGLFLAVLPIVLDAVAGEGPARRLAAGLLATALFAWAATTFVFQDRGLAGTYALLGVAATFASAFEGWRRWAASAVLGLVVAATLLASRGQSLGEGRNFGAAVVIGLAFCAPAIAAVVFAPEGVSRAERALDVR